MFRLIPKNWATTVVLILSVLCLVPMLQGQTVTASLTGTVADASGAVIPGANVTVKSQATGDIRRSVSNGEGFFNFSGLQPGSYTVTIEAKGFQNWERKDVVLNSGDRRGLVDIALAVGASTETVEVTGAAAEITTVESGEKSAVIGTQQMQNVAIVGSNAAEFIKILPGMAMTSGTENRASYTGEAHGTGAGPIGSFSANGQRSGAMDITSDGAHVIDPGCNCGQAVDVNVDMTQEMKVMTSNFGADAAKGPVLIQAVGKSGTNAFHGQAYLYARHNALNANDWLNNAQGINAATGQQVAPRPETRYLYPGGNIGGPVLIPGTRFNKNRDKLFFFVAYEYYNQVVDNGLYQAFVPTAAMRQGNFNELKNLVGAGRPDIGSNISGMPNTTIAPGGVIPQSSIDPTGQKLMNLYPLPNADPLSNGGFNFVQVSTKPQNAYQFRPRLDWSISDNTKLFVSYNRQRDTAYYTDTLWWRPTPTVPYPSRLIAANESDSISANLTHVFSPSLTNEFVYTYTNLNLPNYFEDPSKVDPSALGLNVPSIFGNKQTEFPSLTGWGGGFANMIQPSGFQVTGSLYANKFLPTVADNLSKVWGTHTIKAGFYWESTKNDQPTSANANGQLAFANWGGNTTGNAYADLLTGHIAQYSETNKDVLLIMAYKSIDFYAQDSWKVTRRLTVDYGMRFSHLGPWSDQMSNGFAVWRPDLYSNNPADVAKITGVLWHSKDASVPLSGAPSRFLFFNPRFGLAYDVFGTGRTVVRGGWGQYRFHDEQNVQAGALGITQGQYSFCINSCNAVTFNDIANYKPTFQPPGSITALDPNDDQQPMTRSYSFTISQRVPFQSLFEISYVGNESKYLSNWNNNLGRPNQLPYGYLFQPQFLSSWSDPANVSADPLRPFTNYSGAGGIKIINHQMFSNYNSLQASWNKQAGRINWLANYTWSKSMGIRGEGGGPTGDPTNLANNYGTLANDRSHIFNLAYVIEGPRFLNRSWAMRGFLGGWQASGITQVQSGVNLQAAISSNFGLSSTVPAGTVLPNGVVLTNAIGAGSTLINGTPDIGIAPVVLCDPRSNLGPNEFINGSCFAPPTPGHNGSFIMPYIKGPAFFNSDLSLFKNFNFSEQKKLQFRVSGYNFLNHPITSFVNGDNNLNLNFGANGQLVNSRFGYADWKAGHRIIQLALKYYF